MGERVTDEQLRDIVQSLAIEDAAAKARGQAHGNYGEDFGAVVLDLRDCRAALAEAQRQVSALREALIATTGPDYDCPACDRGVLRQRVDGREPEHWDDCPAARAVATLLDTAAAAQAFVERVRSEERERCHEACMKVVRYHRAHEMAPNPLPQVQYLTAGADECASAIRALSPSGGAE